MNRSTLVAATAVTVLLLSACATPRHQAHEEPMKSMSEHCKKQMEQMHAQRHDAHAAAGAASAPAAHECPMMKKG
jgi:hypothetical protein